MHVQQLTSTQQPQLLHTKLHASTIYSPCLCTSHTVFWRERVFYTQDSSFIFISFNNCVVVSLLLKLSWEISHLPLDKTIQTREGYAGCFLCLLMKPYSSAHNIAEDMKHGFTKITLELTDKSAIHKKQTLRILILSRSRKSCTVIFIQK